MSSVKVPQEVLNIFPYESIRPIQDKLIYLIYSSLKQGKNVIIEGANGLGKTVATLASCIPIAREKKLQIIHVCRTNKQADRVIEELSQISKKTKVSGVSLRGRKEMCLNPLIQKHADDAATASILCGQLKKLGKCDFNLRMTERLPFLTNVLSDFKKTASTTTNIMDICEANKICPYEFVLKLVEEVDVVAASYQYIFNPSIRDIFMNRVSRGMNDLLLIVDECHNIVDTAIDISSDQLTIFSIRQALKEIKAFNKIEFLKLLRCLSEILEENQEKSEFEKKIDANDLIFNLSKEIGASLDLDYCEKLISAGMKIQREYLVLEKAPKSFLHRVGQFLRKLVLTKNRSEFLHLITSYQTFNEGWGVKFEVVSLDARYTTKHVFDNVCNSIHISGTIDPIEAYSKIVGMSTLPINTEVLASPYSEKNVKGLIISKLSTKLDDRTEETYKKMCEIINEAVTNTPGNTGIFTASYAVSDGLLSAGIEHSFSKPLFYETSNMSATANDRLVSEFKKMSIKGGAVLMGVLGGRSSEGADFPGEEMNTCIIVGIPYAKPSTRIDSQINYLEGQFPKKGREYGYIIPAMRRASQAAGRPIRSLDDQGLIIFLDYRFGYSTTMKFLPVWLRKNTQMLDYEKGRIASIAKAFYKR